LGGSNHEGDMGEDVAAVRNDGTHGGVAVAVAVAASRLTDQGTSRKMYGFRVKVASSLACLRRRVGVLDDAALLVHCHIGPYS
jgi:predicted glycoside hydrolase/deacetylase ChbG (UPF0249 family)